MAKRHGVSSKTHTQQQVNHYANQKILTMQLIKQIMTTMQINAILIIQIIKVIKMVTNKNINQ